MPVSAQEDDGFRQIELSGKQLVFLVMAATTVLAVSFMLGMLVGRGVRAEREEAANIESLSETPPTPPRVDTPPNNPYQGQTPPEAVLDEPFPDAITRNGAPAKTDTPTPAAKPSEASVPKAADTPAARVVEKPAEKPAAPPSKPADPTPAKAPAPPPVAKPAPSSSVATSRPAMPQAANGSGYTVQVAAVNERTEAEAIVRRLSGKGYAAYVEAPKGGTTAYRVRVGTFESRRDAQTVADRLTKEERFKPWVTR